METNDDKLNKECRTCSFFVQDAWGVLSQKRPICLKEVAGFLELQRKSSYCQLYERETTKNNQLLKQQRIWKNEK